MSEERASGGHDFIIITIIIHFYEIIQLATVVVVVDMEIVKSGATRDEISANVNQMKRHPILLTLTLFFIVCYHFLLQVG